MNSTHHLALHPDWEPDSFAGCCAVNLESRLGMAGTKQHFELAVRTCRRWLFFAYCLYSYIWAVVKYSVYLYSLLFCWCNCCQSHALRSQVLFIATLCIKREVCILLVLIFPSPFILIHGNIISGAAFHRLFLLYVEGGSGEGAITQVLFLVSCSLSKQVFTAGSLARVLKEIVHGLARCRGEVPVPKASPRAAVSASESSSHGSQHMPRGNKS